MNEPLWIDDTPGKTIKTTVRSHCGEKLLVQFTDDSMIVLAAQTDYAGNSQLGIEDFDRHAFDTDDLLPIFGEEQVAQWNRKDDERHEQFLAEYRENRRQDYERLKAEFEPTPSDDNAAEFNGKRLAWGYNLTAACRFLSNSNLTLLWYGVPLLWTRYGIGVLALGKERKPQ